MPLTEEQRQARNAYVREWRKRNPEKAYAATKRYHEKNPGKAKAWQIAWKAKNPEYNREWSKANNERRTVKARELRAANPERYRAYVKKWQQGNKVARTKYMRRKRRECPRTNLVERLRNRINDALRNARTRKAESTLDLVGCSLPELMAHLQALFTPGMSWNNRGKWHVDHIRPCASFDLMDPEQRRKCFHFTNLQPLWATENVRKSARMLQ